MPLISPTCPSSAVHIRACAAALFAGTAVLSMAPDPAAAQSPTERVVVFGDSISDGGAYAALAPAGAGRFTTNPDPVWVELVAAGLGQDLAPRATGGLNFAEGGARVATPRPGGPGGLTRTPVVNQIDAYLAGGGAFDARTLVILQGGGNDVFATQANGLDFTPADLAVLDGAATALAAQATRLTDAGAGTVVTTSVPKFEVFNSRYRTALALAGANVLYVDIAALIGEIEADPATYGIRNITDPACRGAAVQSFVCRPQDYVAPDANRTYLFADGVHFTGAVHEMQAQLTLAMLIAPTQVSRLPYVVKAAGEAQRGFLATHLTDLRSGPEPGWRVFGGVALDDFDVGGATQQPGLQSDARRLSVGVERVMAGRSSFAAGLHLSEGDGEFGDDVGGFDAQSLGVSAVLRRAFGPVEARLTADYVKTDFDDVTREIRLGPALRSEVGETSGDAFSLGAEADMALVRGPFELRPGVGLRYERVKVDSYAEAGTRSSQITFGGQTRETLTAAVNLRLSPADRSSPLRPYVEAGYAHDLLGEDPMISIRPSGAPTSFRTAAYKLDGDYVTYGAGLEARLGRRAAAMLGVHGTAARDGATTVVGFVGLRAGF